MTVFLTVVSFTNAFSQTMDSSFTYQGELIDNGVPANGQYDINLDLIDGDLQPWGNTSVHSPVNVVNGVFSVNADFNISYYNGYKDFTVTVSVRKTSEGPGGAFTTLGSQTIQAVPMATNLTNGSATTGQVLTFNGFQWQPMDPAAGGSSPWTVVGSEIIFDNNVGIGTANPFTRLHVESSSGLNSIFNGGNQMYVLFEENGDERGYIGSYQDASISGINDEDFEIGTSYSSTGSMHIVTGENNPRITVSAAGNVGINNLTPNQDFVINGATDGDVMRVNVNGDSKFLVDDNGGVGIGSLAVPPENGLDVEGNVKQPVASNGLMKYMVYVTGCGTLSPSITRSYNGVSTGSITVADDAEAGECVIDFPVNINARYWQVTALGNGGYAAQCTQSLGNGNDKLSCHRFLTSTGAGFSGSIMVLVY